MKTTKELKNEMHRIVTEMYGDEHNYDAESRIEAAKAYALLVIAEALNKDITPDDG